MKYCILGFNQQKVLGLTKEVKDEKKDKFITISIDVEDLLILSVIADLANRKSIRKVVHDDGQYAWISYNVILEDLPILRIDKKQLRRRLDKLVEFDLIDLKVERINGSGTFVFIKIGKGYEELKYNTGEEGNKILMLGYNQLMAYVSLDDDTVVIDRNLRLFVDYNKVNPIPYKVTRPDTVTFSYGKNRVMCLVLTEDQYNPKTDSIENWLCDYFKPETPTTKDIEITFNGEPIIRSGGSAKTFKADGAYSVNLWELELLSIQKDFVSLSYEGNTCKVRCKQNDNLVGTKFTLKCQDNDGHFGQAVIKIGSGV